MSPECCPEEELGRVASPLYVTKVGIALIKEVQNVFGVDAQVPQYAIVAWWMSSLHVGLLLPSSPLLCGLRFIRCVAMLMP